LLFNRQTLLLFQPAQNIVPFLTIANLSSFGPGWTFSNTAVCQ